ncbi:MAG TPA: Gfo/Idh/MocA family oxidoreductase [Opitutaceae bacterium]
MIIGAGGIVRDAHLPAYRLAGFPVAGLYDVEPAKARELATAFDVPAVFPTLAKAVSAAPPGTIFDVAVPAAALADVLRELPEGAAVLVQKPFGETLEQARALLALCHQRRLRAAVNFQLRFAPAMVAARELIARGAIGELHDIDVRVTVHMPWHLWTFLASAPRLEILYHSVHYIDLIRSFFGDPRGIYAKTVRHPSTPGLASTRTTMALDYGDLLRATVTTNHGHDFGPRHQESYVKWEGTRGAIRAQLGLLLDYPHGGRDILEVCTVDATDSPREWREVAVDGQWFPHAFIGTMASLQRYAAGETTELPTRVEDAVRTMAVVEAAYQSSQSGATPIPSP